MVKKSKSNIHNYCDYSSPVAKQNNVNHMDAVCLMSHCNLADFVFAMKYLLNGQKLLRK